MSCPQDVPRQVSITVVLVWFVYGGVFIHTARSATPLATTQPALVLQLGHREDIELLALSPDGKMLASAAFDSIKLWDARTGELQRNIPSPKDELTELGGQLAFSPDSKKLLYSTKGHKAYAYSMPAGKLLRARTGVEYSRDGTKLIQRKGRRISFSDPWTGRRLGSIEAHPAGQWPEFLDFSPDGKLVAASQLNSAYATGKLRLWNVRTGKTVHILADPRGAFGKQIGVIGPVAWSPDGKTLATGGEDPNYKAPVLPPGQNATDGTYVHRLALKIWDVRTGKLRRTWPGHFNTREGPQLMAFLDNRRLLIDGQIWDIQTGKLVRAVQEQEGQYSNRPSSPFALASNGKTLAAGSSGRHGIDLWDLATGRRRRTLPRAAAGFTLLAWSPDGKWLAGGGSIVHLWDARTARLARALPGMNYTTQLAFLPTGAVAAGNLQGAMIWDAATGQIKNTVLYPKGVSEDASATIDKGFKNYSNGVYVSPNGKLFVTQSNVWAGGKRGTLEVRDVATRKLLRAIEGFSSETAYLDHAVWTSDGMRLSYGSATGAKLWNLETGKLERTFPDPVDAAHTVRPLAVSPDGKILAGLSTRNNSVILWEIATGKVVRVILERDVRRAALSPDASLLAISDTHQIRVYDARSSVPDATAGTVTGSKPRYILDLKFEFDHAITFSPDGQTLAGSDGGTTKLWTAIDGRLRVTLFLFPLGREDVALESSEWLALTPENYYGASPGAEQFIRWRVGDSLFPAAEYAGAFQRPDLVQKALRGG